MFVIFFDLNVWSKKRDSVTSHIAVLSDTSLI